MLSILILLVCQSVIASCNSYSASLKRDLVGTCVCTEDECHELLPLGELSQSKVAVYTTSKQGKRFQFDLKDFGPSNLGVVNLNVSQESQTILGFGGSFTDAASINLYKMSPKLQEVFMNAYFSRRGSEYSVGRVPISSADFSESVYSYNDVDGDLAMKNFSIERDRDIKIPFIKRALLMQNLTLFASSWAPPSWMLEKNTTINSKLKGTPGGIYWKSYALYLSKFFTAYREEGIPFWGMTTQNEPVKPPIPPPGVSQWQTLRFNAKEEKDFIVKDLGPKLRQDHPDLKIIIYDDQKAGLDSWTSALDDPEASKYVSGTGVHWYSERDYVLTSGSFDKLAKRHARYPDKFILATEACEGFLPFNIGTGAGTKLNNPNIQWQRAENYARDIIGDLNNWVVGWTDWNLVLDERGGPNWAGNFVDAPIIVSNDGKEFFKQPMYYVMAHFSKFIPPGSVKIQMDPLPKLDSVAFKTPSNQIVVVVHNRGSKSVDYSIRYMDKSISGQADGDSLQTIVFQL